MYARTSNEVDRLLQPVDVPVAVVLHSRSQLHPGDDVARVDLVANRRAGGVACYVKDDVLYTRMVELEDQSYEVLWLKLMPKKLPRAFSCIILACMYHPPGANSAAMRDHVINGVDYMVTNW